MRLLFLTSKIKKHASVERLNLNKIVLLNFEHIIYASFVYLFFVKQFHHFVRILFCNIHKLNQCFIGRVTTGPHQNICALLLGYEKVKKRSSLPQNLFFPLKFGEDLKKGLHVHRDLFFPLKLGIDQKIKVFRSSGVTRFILQGGATREQALFKGGQQFNDIISNDVIIYRARLEYSH